MSYTPIGSARALYTPAVADAMAAADRVEWFRLEPPAWARRGGAGAASPDTSPPRAIEGAAVRYDGPVQGEDGARELTRLLLDDGSYRWGSASGCKPTPGVLARLRSGGQTVSFLLCFECVDLQAVARDAAGEVVHRAYHNFIPARPALTRLVKRVFPDDNDIQALDESPVRLVRRGPPRVG